jgi:hypothetical protein
LFLVERFAAEIQPSDVWRVSGCESAIFADLG